jgi:hypothetical protein
LVPRSNTKLVVEQKDESAQKEDTPSNETKTDAVEDKKEGGNDENKGVESKDELQKEEVCVPRSWMAK